MILTRTRTVAQSLLLTLTITFIALIPAAPVRTAPTQDQALVMMTYQMVLLRAPTPGSTSAATGATSAATSGTTSSTTSGTTSGTAARATAQADPAAMQQAHLAHLAKLNAARVNMIYGPFLDNLEPRGMAILDVPDEQAARRAFADDPYVKAGILVIDVLPWFGPKGWFSLPATPATPEPLIFGILKRGPTRAQSQEDADRLQAGHLAYMEQLHAQGKLVMAGPFGGDGDWRGLVVYRVPTVADARALAEADPAVKAGRLAIDVRPWMTFKGILK